MAMAFRKVRTGRPGPVSLDLPSDVLQGAVEGDDVRWVSNYYTDAPPLGHPDQVKRAVELLLHAECPMLIRGQGGAVVGACCAIAARGRQTTRSMPTHHVGLRN